MDRPKLMIISHRTALMSSWERIVGDRGLSGRVIVKCCHIHTEAWFEVGNNRPNTLYIDHADPPASYNAEEIIDDFKTEMKIVSICNGDIKEKYLKLGIEWMARGEVAQKLEDMSILGTL